MDLAVASKRIRVYVTKRHNRLWTQCPCNSLERDPDSIQNLKDTRAKEVIYTDIVHSTALDTHNSLEGTATELGIGMVQEALGETGNLNKLPRSSNP